MEMIVNRDFSEREARMLDDIDWYVGRGNHSLTPDQTMHYWRQAVRDLASFYINAEAAESWREFRVKRNEIRDALKEI